MLIGTFAAGQFENGDKDMKTIKPMIDGVGFLLLIIILFLFFGGSRRR